VSKLIERKVDHLVLWGAAVALQAAVTLLKLIRRSEIKNAPAPETQARAKAAFTA
jgi:hypothetical protein